MNRAAKLACVAFGLILPTATGADELAPLEGGTFSLNEHTASVYYTDTGGAFEVVTTIASDADHGAPARFTTQLAPSQVATISVGAFGTAEDPAVLRLERDGDRLLAEIVPDAQLAIR